MTHLHVDKRMITTETGKIVKWINNDGEGYSAEKVTHLFSIGHQHVPPDTGAKEGEIRVSDVK